MSVGDLLAALSESYSATDDVLGARRRAPGQRVRGGLPSGIHLHQGAVDARADARAVLASWSALVADERPAERPAREVPAMVEFLLANETWLVGHAAAPDLVAELTTVEAGLRGAVDDGPAAKRVGTCSCGLPLLAADGAVRCADGHDVPARDWLLLRGVA